MAVDSPYLVRPGQPFRLRERATDERGDFDDKEDARKAASRNLKKLDDLQERLYAQGRDALLVVFQAMDTGGKDGAIEFVFSGVNPQGCQITSFKVPTPLEQAHDYLWRVHAAVPPKGMIGVFNRSHYESVLIERVKGLVPEGVWSRRYDHINAFERLLADEGVTIVKFFLHISKDEQKRRLEARLANPEKRWKFNAKDLAERKHWDDYQKAFEDALGRCSTSWAPWYVVPADHKWFRDWVVSDVIVRTLEKLDPQYPPGEPGLDGVEIE